MTKFVFALFVLVACNAARADTSYDFVRLTCVPETGLLAIEYRSLHDAVVGANAQRVPSPALARHGLHRPQNLDQACQLRGARYRITAKQAPTSNFMCGGSPEIYLSVARNGVALVDSVAFGYSCNQYPSVQSITLGDGLKGRHEREARICYSTGRDNEPERCEYEPDFKKTFPLNQDAVRRATGRD